MGSENGEDGDERADQGSNNASSASGKRRRNLGDDGFESQQSILKWMRHVPGPLHDVMKKQADQMDCSLGDRPSQITSASSDRFSVAIVTVFDQGPWVDMCQYLGMAATPGKLYGNIKIGSLKCTLRDIVEDDQALSKVPQLLVLIKSLRYVDEEIVAVLQDPTGEIEGYFHRELVEQLGPALAAGVGVLLYKVSVFTPTDAPVTGKRKSYLNITPRNVRRVFVTKEQANSSSSDATVDLFNQAKQDEAEDDSDNDDYDDSQSTSSQQAGRQLLQHNAIRDTSAELTFLSQRQVIHRNPPVRVDPAAAATAKKGKRGKKAAGKTQENSTGLGRWQWSKLLKKNADNNPDEPSPAAAQPRQDADVSLDASSRLASLISRQSSRDRSQLMSDQPEGERAQAAPSKPKKAVSVSFAPGTAFDPLPTPRNSDNRDVTEITPRIPSPDRTPSASVVVATSQSFIASDDDDDDDDW